MNRSTVFIIRVLLCLHDTSVIIRIALVSVWVTFKIQIKIEIERLWVGSGFTILPGSFVLNYNNTHQLHIES